MQSHQIFALLVLGIMSVSSCSVQPKALQRPAKVDLEQISIEGNTIRTYISVLDINGKPIWSIAPAEFSLLVNNKSISFDSVQPFRSTGEGVAYALLVDVSGSMRSVFPAIQRAAKQWFGYLGEKDRVAILPVGSNQESLVFVSKGPVLTQAIDRLTPTDNRTLLYDSILRTLRGFVTQTQLPQRRVIVVLTDGVDDDDLSGTTLKRLSEEMSFSAAPIFAIGVQTGAATATADLGLKRLAEIAITSHGMYWPLEGASLDNLYQQIQSRTSDVYVAAVRCISCPYDGISHLIKVSAAGGQSDPVQAVLSGPHVQWYAQPQTLLVVGLIIGVVAVLTWLAIRAIGKYSKKLEQTDMRTEEAKKRSVEAKKEADEAKIKLDDALIAQRRITDSLALISQEQERVREREKIAREAAERQPAPPPAKTVKVLLQNVSGTGYNGVFRDPLRIGTTQDCHVLITTPGFVGYGEIRNNDGVFVLVDQKGGVKRLEGQDFNIGSARLRFLVL